MKPYVSKSVRSATAVALMFAVAACGGGDNADETNEQAADAAAAVSSAPQEVASAGGAAIEDAREALAAAEDTAADAAENAEDAVAGAVETVAASAGAMAAAAGDAAQDAADKVANVAESAAADAAETVETVQASAMAALDGDAAAGKRVFVKCMACHTVQEGQHRVGPSLYGIVGRTAGTIEGFNYTDANKNSGAVWTPDVLFTYLEDPVAFMPGTRMIFAGLPSEQERADLIAYLQSVSE